MKTLQGVMDMLRERMTVTTDEQIRQNYAMQELQMAGSSLGESLATMTEEQKKSTIEYSKGIYFFRYIQKCFACCNGCKLKIH